MHRMDRSEAIADLKSSRTHVRLKAARYLSAHAEEEDEQEIRRALNRESVTWICTALSNALNSLNQDSVDVAIDSKMEEDDLFDQAHAIAVENTSRLLLHEIEPIVGAIRVALRSEIDDYQHSRAWQELDRLEAFLHAIGRLSKSASSPRLKEFDLSETIDQIVSQELPSTTVNIELVGRQPLIVFGDPDMVDLIVRNGLRNAIEAMESDKLNTAGSIIITWGDTDIEYWVAIIDKGVGMPIGVHRVWDIGSSTKKGHLGMGLPIARQASRSLGGTLSLIPRAEAGARFEFRWPAPDRANQ